MAKYLDINGLTYFWQNKVKNRLDLKVDKVTGKGLSTNDFTDSYKNKIGQLEDNTSALASTKVDKVTGKGLSTNDFTAAYKNKVDQKADALDGHMVDYDNPHRVVNISGNAGSATKFETSRRIGNADFDGSDGITLAQMGAIPATRKFGDLDLSTDRTAVDVVRALFSTETPPIYIPTFGSQYANNGYATLPTLRDAMEAMGLETKGYNENANDTQKPLILTSIGTPNSTFWYVWTAQYDATRRKQIAMGYYDHQMQTRYRDNGGWSAWVPIPTGAVQKLWSGAWTSGAITITGIHHYKAIIVGVTVGAYYINVHLQRSSASGNFVGSETRYYSGLFHEVSITMGVATNTLTLSSLGHLPHTPSGNHGAVTTDDVTILAVDAG